MVKYWRKSRAFGDIFYLGEKIEAAPQHPLEFTERGLRTRVVSHCGLMPANLITLPHFSVWSAMSLPNVAGGPGSGTFPRSARRAFSLGSTSPALTALFSTSTISAGVLRGAPIP